MWLKPGHELGWANSILRAVYSRSLDFAKAIFASTMAYEINHVVTALPGPGGAFEPPPSFQAQVIPPRRKFDPGRCSRYQHSATFAIRSN
jgi:hypothetical protein